jgi:hypothetical protein
MLNFEQLNPNNAMLKKGILIFSSFLCFLTLNAQDSRFKLGLRFAPGISSTRVEDLDDTDYRAFTANSSALRFSAGLSGDFFFGRNYAFYSGLWFTVMNANIKGVFDSTGLKGAANSDMNIQYLQIPVALKLFTNEIATDARLYFIVGGTGSIAIKKAELDFTSDVPDKFKNPDPADAYSILDAGLLLGAGVEYRLGEATSVFGGLSYNRGLLNVSSKSGPLGWRNTNVTDRYNVSLGIFSLEMGVYF